jgi:hypothetical protein
LPGGRARTSRRVAASFQTGSIGRATEGKSMETAVSISWLAVLVAAIVRFAIGAGWYTALFGKRWRELMKVPEGAAQDGFVQAMVVGFITDLVMAYVLARFVAHYDPTLWGGILVGFMAWLGFVATVMAGSIVYEKKPMELIGINGGYQLVTLVVMGAILGVWH